MTKISATQAAKLAKVSTPTITRAIDNGVISAEKNKKGGYLIDPSEVDRFISSRVTKQNVTPKILQSETSNEIAILQRENQLLKEMLDDTKSDRDQWRNQAEKITNLLEDQRKKKWWNFRI